jgi:hypothetical protein
MLTSVINIKLTSVIDFHYVLIRQIFDGISKTRIDKRKNIDQRAIQLFRMNSKLNFLAQQIRLTNLAQIFSNEIPLKAENI